MGAVAERGEKNISLPTLSPPQDAFSSFPKPPKMVFALSKCVSIAGYFKKLSVLLARCREKNIRAVETRSPFCCCFLGFPVIIVAISLGATQADGYGSPEGCWLDVPSGLVWAFIAPAILIILVSGICLTLNTFSSLCSLFPLPIKLEARDKRQRKQ